MGAYQDTEQPQRDRPCAGGETEHTGVAESPLRGDLGSNCAALPGTQQDWGLNQHLPQAINSDQLLSCVGEGGAGDVC